jgi:hypothetical protein
VFQEHDGQVHGAVSAVGGDGGTHPQVHRRDHAAAEGVANDGRRGESRTDLLVQAPVVEGRQRRRHRLLARQQNRRRRRRSQRQTLSQIQQRQVALQQLLNSTNHYSFSIKH